VSLRFTAVAAKSLATSDLKNNVEARFKVKLFIGKTTSDVPCDFEFPLTPERLKAEWS
jgi:hypothetical protein